MMHHKPLLFFNITPINPNGMTVVDLGEMDEGLEVTRHSSLPPESPTRETHEYKSRGARHGSLPPKLTKIRFPSPAEGLDEVSEDESDAGAPSVSHGETDNPAKDSAGTSSKGNNEVASLRTANGAMLPYSSAGIKNERIKTRWFTVWSKTCISKPYTLHTSVQLELGDLFINRFYSERHQAQALQVWLLVKGSDSNDFMWRQVDPNEKTFHPKLKTRVLGFQPNDMSAPTWIKPNTDRRSRAMPLIVNGQGNQRLGSQ